MPEINNDMRYLQSSIMRAAKEVRHRPGDQLARDTLARLRSEFAEKKLENYIQKTVATAPPFTAEQRERLTELIRHGRKPVRLLNAPKNKLAEQS